MGANPRGPQPLVKCSQSKKLMLLSAAADCWLTKSVLCLFKHSFYQATIVWAYQMHARNHLKAHSEIYILTGSFLLTAAYRACPAGLDRVSAEVGEGRKDGKGARPDTAKCRGEGEGFSPGVLHWVVALHDIDHAPVVPRVATYKHVPMRASHYYAAIN